MSLSDVSPLQRSAPEPSAPNRTRLNDGWRPIPAPVRHPFRRNRRTGRPDVLLALTAHTFHACRLTQPLQLPFSDSLEDVVLCYTCRASGSAFLEAGGVLERGGAAPHIAASAVHKTVAEADGSVTLTGVAHLDPASLGSGELRRFLPMLRRSRPARNLGFSCRRVCRRLARRPAGSAFRRATDAGSRASPAGRRPPRSRRLCLHCPPQRFRGGRGGRIRASDTLLRLARRGLADHPRHPPSGGGRAHADARRPRPHGMAAAFGGTARLRRHAGARPRTLVADAIASVLAQTHRNFELLVCDDGSRDATPAALAAIEDRRLRVFRHAEKRGAAAARNTCLGEARAATISPISTPIIFGIRAILS